MDTSLFDYDLPEALIAQEPAHPRDHSRLLVLDRATGAWEHKRFFEMAWELRRGDVLVLNDTKVFRARAFGTCRGREVEVFFLTPNLTPSWEALLRPGRRVKVGDTVAVAGAEFRVVGKSEDGVFELATALSQEEVLAMLAQHGHVPTPPYVKQEVRDVGEYQTVYAREVGSVAAPTAGFHFTSELLERVKAQGVEVVFVTLHVGLGTFRPIQADTLDGHVMHNEWAQIPSATVAAINRAKQEGRRVIAVGTTSVRSLEGAARSQPLGTPFLTGLASGFVGDINLFITPGFHFHIVDALITNFHLPRSTLLVLVSAFAGRERILAAYAKAIQERYRFYSFGDAMFIRWAV